jgi:hypothetical protein
MSWYELRQNNSGGSFDYDATRGISISNYIEAASAEKANERALGIGIYFDGVDDHIDCACCGDRWYEMSETDEVDFEDIPKKGEPFIRDDNKSGFTPMRYLPNGEFEVFIHPLGRHFYGAHGEYIHRKRVTTGYGLTFSQLKVGDIFEVGDDGWDVTGNRSAPAPSETYPSGDLIVDYKDPNGERQLRVRQHGDWFTCWSNSRTVLEGIEGKVFGYIATIPKMNLAYILC